MQWNEVESILRENIRLIVLGVLGLIFLGVIIGLIAGLSQRNKAQKAAAVYEQQLRAGTEEKAETIPLPEPVIPKGTDVSGFTLFEDTYTKKLENLGMVSNTLSDLFSGFKRRQTTDIKPFVFKGQNMDTLADSEEIIDP
jgi:type II secretory pathway pseudopilin PulG